MAYVHDSELTSFGFPTKVGYLCYKSIISTSQLYDLTNKSYFYKLLTGRENDGLVLSLHESDLVKEKVYAKALYDPHGLKATRSQFMAWIRSNAALTTDGRSLRANVNDMLKDIDDYIFSRSSRKYYSTDFIRRFSDASIYLDVEEWWNKCRR